MLFKKLAVRSFDLYTLNCYRARHSYSIAHTEKLAMAWPVKFAETPSNLP